MILSGKLIEQHVASGRIEIDPFNPAHVNPVSVDLTLGDTYRVYSAWVGHFHEGRMPHYPQAHVLDVKEPPQTQEFEIPDAGLVVQPNILYLMCTRERVATAAFVPILDGKSSLGRFGIFVHSTAGYGDPGYNGQYTLEVSAIHPVRIYRGMRFCQIRFQSILGEVRSYQDGGHYTGDAARGPVASKAYEQF